MTFEHLSKNKTILLMISIVFFLAGAIFLTRPESTNPNGHAVDESAAVGTVVKTFGARLKNVSLLSPTAAKDLEDNYKDLVSPALLAQWKADPSKAIGRLVSSPWPDSIEIADIKQFGSGAYDVSGKIIDMTSTGMAGSRAIAIGVAKFGDRWLITKTTIAPSEQNAPLSYDGNGIFFQYPAKLAAEYISTQEWPPAIKIMPGTYSCAETPQEVSSMAEIISQRTVNSSIYCVDVTNEGAAGSVYSSYVYTTPKNGMLVETRFVLRYPNCANYKPAQNQACTSEREAFDLDSIVDGIITTLKWETSAVDDNSLAAQIANCLVMSDSASAQKCNELLKQITDFDSCVMAGFSIMKSNPPQCATPDGRTFVQGK